ncbi:hypothetical protein [Chryseosolibacter indicus]|uniref:Uncharacterized protein n=1 Tax=Chryseosolibacter indicus TaxID=2782351 RepID=A0ABS5VYB7_9BACT|nr:hypothetical protein [Chryseosolibacter indicus]MBT1706296.1 hypothetical protein [Chryseosolibacter indicus]
MELLDSDDALKSHLLRKSMEHREQLEEDVKLISERTEKIITNAIIIGGALAATYFVISTLSGSSKGKKKKVRKIKLIKEDNADEQVVVTPSAPEQPSVISQIGTALASQATVLLLNFAKEKLSEYMQPQAGQKEDK